MRVKQKGKGNCLIQNGGGSGVSPVKARLRMCKMWSNVFIYFYLIKKTIK